MTIFFEVIWSNKWYYPKANIIKQEAHKGSNKYQNAIPSNNYKGSCYRLKLRVKL